MRIQLIIDSLGPGGAQRQLSLLGNGLISRGYDVNIMIYYPENHYTSILGKGIGVTLLPTHWRLARTYYVNKYIRKYNPDVVIAFLMAPAMYAELSALMNRSFLLIVGERNLDLDRSILFNTKTQLHRIADYVVANSIAQKNVLENWAPWLMPKVKTIINGVDLDRFIPGVSEPETERYRFLTLARFAREKNGENLIRGFAQWIIGTSKSATLDWFGNRLFANDQPTSGSSEYLRLSKLIVDLKIEKYINIGDTHANPEVLYPHYDAFILASHHEGCANVIAEAMACGLPIIASDVADNAWILNYGTCGFLFDPNSSESLADALSQFVAMSPQDRVMMGHNARERACELFSIDHMVDSYENLFKN